jgi:hypothetical protein
MIAAGFGAAVAGTPSRETRDGALLVLGQLVLERGHYDGQEEEGVLLQLLQLGPENHEHPAKRSLEEEEERDQLPLLSLEQDPLPDHQVHLLQLLGDPWQKQEGTRKKSRGAK